MAGRCRSSPTASRSRSCCEAADGTAVRGMCHACTLRFPDGVGDRKSCCRQSGRSHFTNYAGWVIYALKFPPTPPRTNAHSSPEPQDALHANHLSTGPVAARLSARLAAFYHPAQTAWASRQGNPLRRYVSYLETLERMEMPNVLLNPVSGVGSTLTDLPFDSMTADSSSAPAVLYGDFLGAPNSTTPLPDHPTPLPASATSSDSTHAAQAQPSSASAPVGNIAAGDPFLSALAMGLDTNQVFGTPLANGLPAASPTAAPAGATGSASPQTSDSTANPSTADLSGSPALANLPTPSAAPRVDDSLLLR